MQFRNEIDFHHFTYHQGHALNLQFANYQQNLGPMSSMFEKLNKKLSKKLTEQIQRKSHQRTVCYEAN